MVQRNSDQIFNLVSFRDTDQQWKLRTVADTSYITAIEGTEALTKLDISNPNEVVWIYRDEFGIRRKYWDSSQAIAVNNIYPINTSYVIDYKNGTIEFSQVLNSVPQVTGLYYLEADLGIAYDTEFDADKVVILNKLATKDKTYEEIITEGTVDLGITPLTVITDHSGLAFNLKLIEISFSTAEPKNFKVFRITPTSEFDKTFEYFLLYPSVLVTQTELSLEDVSIRFAAGSEFKMTVNQTTNSCICKYHIITDRFI